MKSAKILFSKYKRFYRTYISPNLIYYIEALFMLSILNALGLIPPFLTKIIFDDALIAKDMKLFVVLLAIFLGTNLIISFASSIQTYLYDFLAEKIHFNTQSQYYYHFLKLPQSFFDKIRIGEIMERITDASVIHGIMNILFYDILRNGFILIIFMSACFFLNWKLSLIMLIFIPIYILYNIILGNISRKLEKERWERQQVIGSEYTETFVGVRFIKACGGESKVFRKIKHLILKMREFNLKVKRIFIFWEYLFSMFNSIESFIIFLIAGIFIINGSMSIGEWLAFQVISAKVFEPMKNLLPVNKNIQYCILALNRLNDIYSIPEEKHITHKQIDVKEGNIVFKDVFFGYSDNYDVLNGINLDIKSGQTVAFVGRSGSGKTTLANLIAKFYLPQKGKILIDGVDITEFDVRSLRKNIGFVLQDTYLFYGSIFDNLLLSVSHKNKDEVIEACKSANIHDDIINFPDGYETKLGEKGVRLSGGQKQRISIAQAIIKNPRILILDEATSHLDLETEEKVQESLKYLMRGRTSIVIAHRLSTIENADKICVLDNGKIVESGTHKELLSMDGYYKKLYTRTANL